MKNKMETKKVILLGMLFLLGIVFINSVSAGVSNEGVEYDSEIKILFLVIGKVPVIIDIKDVSNIIISKEDSPEEFEFKIEQRTKILSEISNSVLSTLSEKEFILDDKLISGRGFYGNITKEGFEKLLKDTRVKKIHDNTITGHIESKAVLKNFGIYLIGIMLLIILIIILTKFKKRGHGKKKTNPSN